MDIVSDVDALSYLMMFTMVPSIVVAIYVNTINGNNIVFKKDEKPKKIIVIPLAICSIAPWVYVFIVVLLQAIFGNQW